LDDGLRAAVREASEDRLENGPHRRAFVVGETNRQPR
jgi:hypothetical protein